MCVKRGDRLHLLEKCDKISLTPDVHLLHQSAMLFWAAAIPPGASERPLLPVTGYMFYTQRTSFIVCVCLKMYNDNQTKIIPLQNILFITTCSLRTFSNYPTVWLPGRWDCERTCILPALYNSSATLHWTTCLSRPQRDLTAIFSFRDMTVCESRNWTRKVVKARI